MTGKELLGREKITLKDGNTYTLEVDFFAVQLLESEMGGAFKDIFKLFNGFEKEENFSLTHISILLWGALIKHHEEFEDLEGKKRLRKMAELYDFDSSKEVIEKAVGVFMYFLNQGQPKEEEKQKKN